MITTGDPTEDFDPKTMKNSKTAPGNGAALTPMQAWMFYESIPGQKPWVNLQQTILRWQGRIPAARLARAWEWVVALHPALRTTIVWRDQPKPVQRVAQKVRVRIAERDLSGAGETALETFLEEDRARGIDLEAAPPWRLTLLNLGGGRQAMVWTAHNALIDAASIGIVLEDVFSVLDNGAPVSPGKSAEAHLALCETIAAPAPPEAEPFFTAYLDGFEPPGLTRAPAPGADVRAELLSRVLDRDLTRRITAMAERCGGTLRNLVETAWGLMMARWQNSGDVVFGVTGAGRNLLQDGDRATGCFLNTLPMRMKVGAGTTLGETVAALSRNTRAMRPFEQVSVAEIRRFCKLHSASFLFDTVVMFDRGQVSGVFARSGLGAEGRSAELRSETDLPLSLEVETGEELRLSLEADPAVVPPARARLMLDQLTRLFASIADAGPATRLGDLDMLGPERDAILALGAPKQENAYIGFLDRFRAQVARAPEAVAVEQAGTGERLSYAGLDTASDRLAALLQARGAAPGQIVAIHLGREPDYLTAMLAVLKTGAAFLPVDPGYPDAVRAHMIEDSGTRLVIARTPPPATGAGVIAPDAADRGERALTPVTRDPEGAAYVIYTSGSTGKPKGVVVPDRAMVGHAQAISRLFAITHEDRVFQFMSLSFDFSLEEIMPTLFQGATLVLRSDKAARSGAEYFGEIAPLGLTVLHFPTAFFHVATDYLTASGTAVPESLRLVNIGGERANPAIVQDWLEAAPGVRLLNGYGPTETAITVTFFEPEKGAREGEVPIGTPADHARAYVVAPDGSLAPRGAIGELWIGGVSVGTGYLGLPEKTAEVFLDDPFRPETNAGTGIGARVYRTGDRASWRTDGNLDFFGRNDRQVKMRGFRIDLGHVERVLEKAQPNLRVFAGLRDAGTPAARLLAWAMIAEGGEAVDMARLKAVAETELPPAMRPRIVEVDDFPRTGAGKVDLAALPDPGRPAAAAGPAAPMTDLQRQLAGLFGQVLLMSDIGADDDFYDLGGHSLLAAELVGQIEVKLGRRISVIDLQNHPTPRGLAGVVASGSTKPRNIFAIQPSGSRAPLFGVHILGGRESYYTALARALGPDQPVYGVTIGALARDKPVGVEETAQRYFEEIQTFHPDGPVHLAAVSLGAYFAWELAWLLHQAGREIGHFALFDADGPDGRDTHRGLRWLWAGLCTVRDRGPGAIPAAIQNRINEARYARIAERMREQAAHGGAIEIRNGNDFIASNDLAVSRYSPKPLNVPCTVYRSRENHFDTGTALENGLGWDRVALAGWELVDVPGGHLSMLDTPNVETLAAEMARRMAR